jgi:hypothetical protein
LPLTDDVSSQVVEKLITFLLDKKDRLTSAAVTTHACLIAAWKQMSWKQRRSACRKLHLYVDEAHHVGNAGVGEEESDYAGDENNLGGILGYILDNYEELEASVVLMTATFFRSAGSVVGEKHIDKFEVYRQDIIEHITSLHLDDLRFGLISYTGDPIEAAAQAVYDEAHGSAGEPIRSIVRVPCKTRGFRASGSKYYDPEAIKRTFQKKLDALFGRKTDVVYFLSEDHTKDKQYFQKSLDKVDVVVAVNLFDEGTDWPQVNRLFDLAPGQSPIRAIQGPGRTLREHEEKKTVCVYTMVSDDMLDASVTDEGLQEVITQRFTAISMILVTAGTILCALKKLKMKKTAKADKTGGIGDLDYARTILGDRYQDVVATVLAWHEMSGKDSSPAEIRDAVQKVVASKRLPDLSEKNMERLYNSLVTSCCVAEALTTEQTKCRTKKSDLNVDIGIDEVSSILEVMEKGGWKKGSPYLTYNMTVEQIARYRDVVNEYMRQKSGPAQCSFVDKGTGLRCCNMIPDVFASRAAGGVRCGIHNLEKQQPLHHRPCATLGCKGEWTGWTKEVNNHRGLFYCKPCMKKRRQPPHHRPCATPGCKGEWTGKTNNLNQHRGEFYCEKHGRAERHAPHHRPCATPGCKGEWTGKTQQVNKHRGLFYCEPCRKTRNHHTRPCATPGCTGEWRGKTNNLNRHKGLFYCLPCSKDQSGLRSRKLSSDQIREIRAWYASGTVTTVAIGTEYGCSGVTIGNIINRKMYKNVT